MSDFGTLCIAAKCMIDGKSPAIVLCTDKKIENETSSTEVGFKFDKIKYENWVCVLAGNVAKARRLAAKYREILSGRDLTLSNFLQRLAEPARAQRLEYIDDFVYSRHSMSYSKFRLEHDHFSDSMFEETERQILDVSLECCLIIVGFLEEIFIEEQSKEEYSVYHPTICTVDALGRVDIHDHFTAIGSGMQNADAMLNYRGQHKAMPLVRTLYHVYEAKTFAESAPSVGKSTDLAWKDATYPSWHFMNDNGLQYFEMLLDNHKPKSTEDIEEHPMAFPYICTWRDREQMHS